MSDTPPVDRIPSGTRDVLPDEMRELREEAVEHRQTGLDVRDSAAVDVQPHARSSLFRHASTRSICAPTARSRSSIRS